MIGKKYFLITFLLIVFAGAYCYPQTPEDVFNRANDLYRAGKYNEAIKEYESIIKNNIVSVEIYFNLGNAYYRNGQLARAILSYERAVLLRPGDADIKHNLKLAYLRTIDRIEPVPDMFLVQWLRAVGTFLNLETTKLIFIISWILFFGSLASIYLIRRLHALRIIRIVMIISFVSIILSAIMLGIQSFQETSKDKAIITAQIVTSKSSPDVKSIDAFVIHEGLKVKIIDTVEDWVKIILADGKIGWIQSEQCEQI